MRILYDSKSPLHKDPYGCVSVGQSCAVSVHIPSSCHAQSAELVTDCGLSFELTKSRSFDGYDIYEGDIRFDKADLYFYRFHIKTIDGEFDLFKEGYADTNMCEGGTWQISCIPKDFKTPDGFKGKVMYQIFPDRFFKDGSPPLEDKLTPYIVHESTDELPHYLPDGKGEILNNDFFGGNLKGIEKKLPYIKELGVGVIYLNPIFKAFSNHRYDTCDYKRIDPMLGCEEDFRSLCNKAHKIGIKIILDGVFSHTGADSIYFDSKNRFGTGVMSDTNSPYKEWYTKGQDGRYESWWGIETLPCVNELCQSYLDYIILSDDSVIKHWLSLGADGFRLDVADELPDVFISMLRSEVKKVNPDAIVIGEVWEDASNKISYGVRRRYFTGGELDSVMNYPFRSAIIDLCTESINAAEFCQRIMTITENYPHEALCCLMNSLSTHDTPRIMTILSGAPLNMSRSESAEYVISDRQKQNAYMRIYPAVMLLFFLPGSSSVYYGDETGTFGFSDPFNRGYFDWSIEDSQIRDLYTQMAKIKNSYPSLKDGKLYIKSNENTIYMERTNGKDTICAVLNLSDSPAKVYAGSTIITHNATCLDECMYIHKYGFAIYE